MRAGTRPRNRRLNAATVRVALILNVAMFLIGLAAGYGRFCWRHRRRARYGNGRRFVRLGAHGDKGEVHQRTSYICTRADVIANIGVFVSSVIVWASGLRFVDLIAGFAIGAYVLKEALEIMREANEAREPAVSA